MGESSVEELVADPIRIELWRYALVIALGDVSFENSVQLLRPLISSNPGLASEVLFDAIPATAGEADIVSLPTARKVGEMIVDATDVWLAGLGALAPLLLFARGDGTAFPLGIAVHEGSVEALWRSADDVNERVVELPSDVHIFGGAPGWGPGRLARPPTEPAWPWRWSLDGVVSGLKPLVDNRLLATDSGPLHEEEVWQQALVVLHAGSLHPGPLPLEAIEARLEQIPNGAVIHSYRGAHDLAQLRSRVAELRANNETEMPAPWPGPDKDDDRVGGWVWDGFSAERLLERTVAVYRGALVGYTDLVERWFATLAPRLRTYVTLPARLTGVLDFREFSPDSAGPVLNWYLDPLDPSEQSSVELELGDYEAAVRRDGEQLRAMYERLRALRPSARSWIDAQAMSEVLEVFGAAPARELAFRWLADDLKRVRLVR